MICFGWIGLFGGGTLRYFALRFVVILFGLAVLRFCLVVGLDVFVVVSMEFIAGLAMQIGFRLL